MGLSLQVKRFAASAKFTLAAVLLVAVLTACPDTTLSTGSDLLTISQGSDIYDQAGTFSFTAAKSGEDTITRSFVVSNTGTASISILKIEYSNPENFTFYSSSLPGALEIENESEFDFNFHPRHEGRHESEISIYIDGYEEPVILHLVGDAH
jgi:hypothetical protein